MFLSVLWLLMLLSAFLTALFRGTASTLAASVLNGAQRGIELLLAMSGSLCLWSGFSRLCERSGLSGALARLAHPLLRHLFPSASKSPESLGCLCENLTANLLGLGNAATPPGIRAVRSMRDARHPETATDEMCLLVVLNTASVQLLPTTVAALRAGLGAAQPFDLLPAVWVSSLLSVSAGILTARFFARRWRE